MKFHVLCCPGRTPIVKGGIQVWDEKREGHFPAYVKCLRQALKDCNGPVTILEDDCEIPDGWTDYVEHYYEFIQRTGQVVQWWWNGRMLWDGASNNVHLMVRSLDSCFVHRPAGRFLSTQAVTYSRGVGFLLLAELEHMLSDAPKDDEGRKHSGDAMISRVLYEQRQDFLIHWPPIAQHVGEQSLVAPGMGLHDGFRTNPYYSRNTAERIIKTRPVPMVLFPGEYDER